MLTSPFAHLQAFLLYPAIAAGTPKISAHDTPTLQPFVAPASSNPTGASVIICPGGGYMTLASHEGITIAQWLNQHGITAFVLRYRTGPQNRHPIPLSDAQRALRFVRYHAPQWNLDPQRIGMLGFSAGGHLTATAATHFDAGDAAAADPMDRLSSRPDVQVLIYPLISFQEAVHRASYSILMGETPDPQVVASLSNETQVSPQTPPAFLVHSTADATVAVAHSDLYAQALKAHHISYEYIRGDFGGHGFGLKDCWDAPCIRWLRSQGF